MCRKHLGSVALGIAMKHLGHVASGIPMMKHLGDFALGIPMYVREVQCSWAKMLGIKLDPVLENSTSVLLTYNQINQEIYKPRQ